MLLSEQKVSKKLIVPEIDYLTYYYYGYGDECNFITGGWVEGYSYSSGTQSKEIDHLKVNGTYNGARRTYVTNNPINLAWINTLKIDWVCETQGNAVFVVLNNKMDDYVNSVAMIFTATSFSRQIGSLDVSSLTGSYYIGVVSNPLQSNVVRAYRIWGEK